MGRGARLDYAADAAHSPHTVIATDHPDLIYGNHRMLWDAQVFTAGHAYEVSPYTPQNTCRKTLSTLKQVLKLLKCDYRAGDCAGIPMCGVTPECGGAYTPRGRLEPWLRTRDAKRTRKEASSRTGLCKVALWG